jgi:uncharacterized protein YukJ
MRKKNYIIVCDDYKQSEFVQKKILATGYAWTAGGIIVQYTDKPVIIFDNLNSQSRSMSYHTSLMNDDYKCHSCYKNHLTISANNFLALETF